MPKARQRERTSRSLKSEKSFLLGRSNGKTLPLDSIQISLAGGLKGLTSDSLFNTGNGVCVEEVQRAKRLLYVLNLQSLATPPVSANMSITTLPLHATARASRALQNAWEKVAEVTICRLSQPNGTSSNQAGPTDSQHRKRHACGQKIVEPGKSNGSDADDDGRAPRCSGESVRSTSASVTNENGKPANDDVAYSTSSWWRDWCPIRTQQRGGQSQTNRKSAE
ncbi:hypothetical protein GQ600_9098 [Phytophthora cactorum]|nr:hypothetical protein GQ600_9098 [Phytophthora cactorum]